MERKFAADSVSYPVAATLETFDIVDPEAQYIAYALADKLMTLLRKEGMSSVEHIEHIKSYSSTRKALAIHVGRFKSMVFMSALEHNLARALKWCKENG